LIVIHVVSFYCDASLLSLFLGFLMTAIISAAEDWIFFLPQRLRWTLLHKEHTAIYKVAVDRTHNLSIERRTL